MEKSEADKLKEKLCLDRSTGWKKVNDDEMKQIFQFADDYMYYLNKGKTEKEIVDNSGYTICEDKSTCTVFGMPAAAIDMGAASRVLPRNCIARAILNLVR